jgi:hypothetical protein
MDDTGRSEGRVAGGQMLGPIADLNHAAAFQNQVELVLALMRVRGVFLTGLKGVQAGKQKAPLCDGALSHLFRRELRKAGDSMYEHAFSLLAPQLEGEGGCYLNKNPL